MSAGHKPPGDRRDLINLKVSRNTYQKLLQAKGDIQARSSIDYELSWDQALFALASAQLHAKSAWQEFVIGLGSGRSARKERP